MSITTSSFWDGRMFSELRELIKVDIVYSLQDCVDSMPMKTYDPEGLARSLVRCHRPEYSDIAKHVKDTLPSVDPSEFEFKSTTSVKLDSVGGESCCQVMLEVLPKEDGATWLKGPPVFVQAKATLSGNPPIWSSVISGRSWNKPTSSTSSTPDEVIRQMKTGLLSAVPNSLDVMSPLPMNPGKLALSLVGSVTQFPFTEQHPFTSALSKSGFMSQAVRGVKSDCSATSKWAGDNSVSCSVRYDLKVDTSSDPGQEKWVSLRPVSIALRANRLRGTDEWQSACQGVWLPI